MDGKGIDLILFFTTAQIIHVEEWLAKAESLAAQQERPSEPRPQVLRQEAGHG